MRVQFVAAAVLAMAVSGAAFAKKETKKTAELPAAATGAWKVNPAASEVTWTGSKVLVKTVHHGIVPVKAGEVNVKDKTVTSGWFELDMTQITDHDLKASPADAAKLEGHLKSEDFFNVAKYPTARFTIKSVKAIAAAKAGEPTHEISGDLQVKNVTKPLTFPATVVLTDSTADATAKFKIDRTEWDVRYGSDKFFKGLGDKVISNDIEFAIKINATK